MTLVSYLRVSTDEQGKSGLGLEAQREAISQYAKNNNAQIVTEFVEVESGKRADRPKLAAALAHAKRIKARLVIAKLDRLSRKMAFLAPLIDSGCDLVACDNPHATKLLIHILAAVAEEEADAISKRTKAALAATKARGTKLGSARPGHWQGHEQERLAALAIGRVTSARVRTAKAREAVADLLPEMKHQRNAGKSLQQIAGSLNVLGHRTARGSEWSAMAIKRVLDRA